MRADTKVGRLIGALARYPAAPAASTHPRISADTNVGRLIGAFARAPYHPEYIQDLEQPIPNLDYRETPNPPKSRRSSGAWSSLLTIAAATALLVSAPAAITYFHQHSTTTTATPTPTSTPTAPSNPSVIIRVTGPQATVIISTQDLSQILLNAVLPHGQVRSYGVPKLAVQVDPAQYVEVEINGRVVSTGKTGRQVYTN